MPSLRFPALLVASLALMLLAPGCESCDARGTRDGQVPDFDAGMRQDGQVDRDTGPGRDSGNFDPFDPANGCGSSAIPTERVPGQLLMVFDRSGSMNRAPSGDVSASNPSKWDLSRQAINNVLGSVSDELSMGLLFFPPDDGGSDCDVSLPGGTPDVAMGPLSTTRPLIMSTLNGASAGSSETPMFAGLAAGYDYLDTLTGPGQRGLLLVTDGAETCDESDRDAAMQRTLDEQSMNNYLTYAVGLTSTNNDLSTIAFNGGTPRTDTCLPECTSDLCTTDGDCPTGTMCWSPIAGFPGFCSCNTDADCVMPQTCMMPPFPFPGAPPATCGGDSNCCHYDATAGNFQAEFEAALAEIASRFLDSCVFRLPRGADPSMFDPSQVNVGVTFDGEMRQVLGRGMNATVDSWDFTSPDQTSIIIQGPVCDRLLMEAATVEIVLGCPTILI